MNKLINFKNKEIKIFKLKINLIQKAIIPVKVRKFNRFKTNIQLI